MKKITFNKENNNNNIIINYYYYNIKRINTNKKNNNNSANSVSPTSSKYKKFLNHLIIKTIDFI